MMKKIYTSLWLVFLSISMACYAQTINYNHGGLTRQYIYYEPEGIAENAPLVFVLHGYSGDAFTIRDYTQMNKVADEHKFAVCYPRGSKDEWNNNFWQVGYEFHESETVDDVDFICDLAKYLQEEHNLSKQNTFVTGMSNGGDMSFLLSCKANHVFKAFAPVCGTIMNNRFDYCTAPVPIFAINGDNDKTTWFNGDPDNAGEWGPYLGIPEIIDRFVEANECADNTTESIPNTNTNDGSTIEFDRYYNGIDNNEVWLFRVVNGGHDWPGGSGNRDIDASKEVWKFFTKYLSEESTQISSNKEGHLSIYPNPSNGKVLNISTKIKTPVELCIISSTGKIVYSIKKKLDNDDNIELQSHLPSGIYVLLVKSKLYVYSKKLIVE